MDERIIKANPTVLQRAGRFLLRQIGLHQDHAGHARQLTKASALCVATSHSVLDVGVATGVFASELTVPYYRFLDAGLVVDVASIRGAPVPTNTAS